MKGEELTKWREDRELSQGQLAKKLGVHVITVNRWENGARDIPPLLELALTGLDTLERRNSSKSEKKK